MSPLASSPPPPTPPPTATAPYRGRLAPSPTGLLHLGHARTFWTAQQRCRQHQGTLVLRNEDLDHARCRPEFVTAMIRDLRWFGFAWQEGPDLGGPLGPYRQAERLPGYRRALDALIRQGAVYPCTCSRRDILQTLSAPHAGEEEPVYPGTCRPQPGNPVHPPPAGSPVSWRFCVPDGQTVCFQDGRQGEQSFVAGRDFGDFIVWRHDDIPSYQLAVVADDAAMQITEVVRGLDLLPSTARQLLLYRALQLPEPQFYHCPLVTDPDGVRLAKRHAAFSLSALRDQNAQPEQLRADW